MNNKILFFDTETTGLPKDYKAPITDLDNWPRLVQIAWILADIEGETLEEASFIIKPDGFIIPKEASDIHGVTNLRAIQEGFSLASVLAKFENRIKYSEKTCAHNMQFDKKIVGAEFIRTKIEHELFEKERLCTMLLSTNHCKLPGKFGSYKWPNLTELHTHLFGTGFGDAHDALEDIRACARCFFELKKRGVIKLT